MAEDTLMDAPDGTFLVRVSQSRAGYSLTVKYLEIRHVVIVESNNKFGFSEPTTFDTLPVGGWPKKKGGQQNQSKTSLTPLPFLLVGPHQPLHEGVAGLLQPRA